MKYFSLFILAVLLLSCNNKKENTTENINTDPALTDIVTRNDEMEPIVYDSIISIAELYKNKEKYKNAIIKLRGKVTKYNPGIMNTNWVHIQDGTEFEEEKDITFTTLSTVKMGDTVSIKGKVSLEKDLGAGYIYDVLVENATIE